MLTLQQLRAPERSAGVQSSTVLALAAQGRIPTFDAAILWDTPRVLRLRPGWRSPFWLWRLMIRSAGVVRLETDVLAGFVLARASAGLADSTIQQDVGHLQLVRDCFGRPLWEMQPADADAYFGKDLRDASTALRLARAQSLTTYFAFLELRHKAELHALTGRIVECPIDEVNRPRGSKQIRLRIPPTELEVETLFAGWRADLVNCR